MKSKGDRSDVAATSKWGRCRNNESSKRHWQETGSRNIIDETSRRRIGRRHPSAPNVQSKRTLKRDRRVREVQSETEAVSKWDGSWTEANWKNIRGIDEKSKWHRCGNYVDCERGQRVNPRGVDMRTARDRDRIDVQWESRFDVTSKWTLTQAGMESTKKHRQFERCSKWKPVKPK